MKTAAFRGHKSLVGICVAFFLAYSLIIVLIITLISYIVVEKMIVAFPELDDLLAYSSILGEEKYDHLSKHEFKNCKFVIYDSDYNAVYSTDASINGIMTPSSSDFIASEDSITFSVSKQKRKDGEEYYIITKTRVGTEDRDDIVLGYCFLDLDYNVTGGNLFSDRSKLTEEEVDLLRGLYKNNWNVSSGEFTTDSGEKRIVVFISPISTEEAYSKAESSVSKLWFLALPAALVIIILLTYLLVRRIRAYLRPIDYAITEYSEGRRVDLSKYKIPVEFRPVAGDFDDLLTKFEESREEAKRLYADKQRVFADISHDLKTPLTVIVGYSKALCDGVVAADKKDKYFRIIYRKALNMADLTDSLLEYAKIQHPDYKLVKQTGNICEFSKEYLAEKYQEIELKGMILDVDIPDEECSFSFDGKVIKRVFDNLIGNAEKYNPPGTTIFFKLRFSAKQVDIVLADNGRGIPEQIRNTAFQAFVTGDSARSSDTGTGLGLSIVKKAVELHDGSISIADPPSVGYSTEFDIIFPLEYL